MKILLITSAFITLVNYGPVSAIKIDCDNTESVNEEHIHYCCKHPDGHNDIIDSCAKETGFKMPSPTEESIVDITPERAIAGTCFGECVFKKMKFMKNNETLDMDAVRNHYKQQQKDDPEYAKEMINAFDHCHGKSQENTAKFLSNSFFRDMSEKFCEPAPSVIWACVIREFFHNCPQSRWSQTAECKNTLEFSKSCKDALTTM